MTLLSSKLWGLFLRFKLRVIALSNVSNNFTPKSHGSGQTKPCDIVTLRWLAIALNNLKWTQIFYTNLTFKSFKSSKSYKMNIFRTQSFFGSEISSNNPYVTRAPKYVDPENTKHTRITPNLERINWSSFFLDNQTFL